MADGVDVSLEARLRSISQGDLVSTGAVTIVGRGRSRVADAAHANVTDDEQWSVTVESDPGWYVVISQDCDIVRDVAQEPCVVVCPVQWVSQQRWDQLRNGPYSPRHFPLPEHPDLTGTDHTRPVASLQYVTSVDKYALVASSVRTIRPLTGPQRQRLAMWIGRRYARPAHDDLVDQRVLVPCGRRIRELAGKFQTAQTDRQVTDDLRVVRACEEWFIEASDVYVKFHASVTDASLKAAGLWDDSASRPKEKQIALGIQRLTSDLSKRLPAHGGYTIKVNVVNLASVPAAEYRLSWAQWVLEGEDPLA